MSVANTNLATSDVGALILGPEASIEQIGAHLDSLDHEERVRQVRALKKRHQERLFELAVDAGPLTADFYVPPGTGPQTEVIHHGKNSLPLFTNFQKRFALPGDDSPDESVFGYNEGSTRALIGPGYFVAYETTSESGWRSRGPFVIDYFDVPEGPVPSDWPKVVRNSKGLQRFVYHRTRDFMRRVSSHVSVGAAYRGEKALGAYFVLCREDR